MRKVDCPRCGKACEFSPNNPYRPFCGRTCQLIDLGKWNDEHFVIPSTTDDLVDTNNIEDEERVERYPRHKKDTTFSS